MTPVFDSNIVIDFLEGSHAAKAEIEAYSKRLISVIAYIEAMVGIHNPKRQELVKRVLHEEFEIIPLSDDIVDIAIQIRRDKRLKLPDAIIWATAMQQNTLLITRNSKDFPKSDPTIRIPYVLKAR